MAIRKISFVPEEYYHLYNRGNDKRVVFHDEQDHRRFMVLLYLCNSNIKVDLKAIREDPFIFDRGHNIVAVGAYCLMPNHFHILVTPLVEGGVSKFMQKITTAYSMYYNKRYSRTGSLFEGKFKSEHVDTDRYLKYLFSYIHLNPINLMQGDWKKVGIKNTKNSLNFLEKHNYSSYHEYLGLERKEGAILNRGAFPEYFPDEQSFVKEIFIWLSDA